MVKSERIFEGFWKPFGSRLGPLLAGQPPSNSIIPGVPVSKLFLILVWKASQVGFLTIFGGVGEDVEQFLVPFFEHFYRRFCNIFASYFSICVCFKAKIVYVPPAHPKSRGFRGAARPPGRATYIRHRACHEGSMWVRNISVLCLS